MSNSTDVTIYKINNKDLLNNTGNYIQYLIITYNGKEWERIYILTHTYTYICIYVGITESLCCTPETNITL